MATQQEVLQTVHKLYDKLSRRRRGIKKAFEYFEGEQPLAYASAEWKRFHSARYAGFSDNWCGVVGRSPVDRLRIDGFRLGGPTDVLTSDEKQLWEDWTRNEMGTQSNQGFLCSTIAKRSAVIVWGNDDEEPVSTWEHPSQVIVAYRSGTRERLAALKAWAEDGMEYATLYLPHEIWKWERPAFAVNGNTEGRTDSGLYLPAGYTGTGWQPRIVKDENWPLPNPLGVVPVVEWLNRPMLGGKPISDISGTIAMQDAVNMLWAYLFAAADHASMPARVVLGAEPPKVPILDENGQVVGSRPAKMEDLANGRLLFLPQAGPKGSARIDQWDAAKLDVFTGVVSEAIAHVAAQTSTPGHYLLSNEKFANLNGDALTAAEVPLGTKVENQQLHYNPAAKETAALFALVRGKGELAASIRAADGRRFTQWKDGFTHTLQQMSDAATKDRSIGMSLRTVLEKRYGMTELEIEQEFERIRNERETDQFGLIDPETRARLKQQQAADAPAAAGA